METVDQLPWYRLGLQQTIAMAEAQRTIWIYTQFPASWWHNAIDGCAQWELKIVFSKS